MNIAALMTSAGINIGLCILFFSLYSILRKQPVNFSVYFPRKLAEDQAKCHDSFSLERLVPSASWIKKAWELSEQEILAAAGLDAVVFIRIYVLSMRIFALCAVLCIFILLPVNYYGNQLRHINITHIPFESLDAFTISNVQHGSKRTVVSQLVTGYFPSLILQLFLLIVAPAMKVLSAMQGSISYSGNQKSTCIKVLYFTIWNVFFVNVLSGSVINQINTFISSPKDIPTRLARVVPSQGTFFITYVLTSGWTSLSSEIMQLVCLIWNFFKRCFSKSAKDVDLAPSFPYHQEIPKVLFFGLLGFIWSVLAPLILPFLLVYFSLGYIVYRNQVMNVYCFKYETGGQYWPIVHNCTIFSMVMMQIVAMGVFGLKEARVASTLIIPLVVSTLLFNEYCRKRFSSIFKSYSAEILINKDREDEQSGQLENFLQNLDSAYRHPTLQPVHHLQNEISKRYNLPSHRCLSASLIHPAFRGLQISRIHEMSVWLTMILAYQERRVSR